LNPLQKGLAQMLITDLSKVRKLRVVERLKLQRLLEEMKLGATGLVDPKTAPRVGKLLGTQKLVSGAFTDLTQENMRIDASLTETATSSISEVKEVTGKLVTIFRLEKQLAFQVIDELGIRLTKEEREAIQKIPTESLLAFIAYSKALDFEDRGMYDRARQEYQKALAIDPNFDLAQQGLQEVETAKSAATEPKLPAPALESEFEQSETELPGNALESRLITTSIAAQVGQTPQGDNDTREPVQEDTGTDTPATNAATVPLRIRLPDNQGNR
jgi:tetratricopeptide (TPR) repeat protein